MSLRAFVVSLLVWLPERISIVLIRWRQLVQARLCINSLFSLLWRENSRFGRKKFPVPVRREFRCNALWLLVNLVSKRPKGRVFWKIPCYWESKATSVRFQPDRKQLSFCCAGCANHAE